MAPRKSAGANTPPEPPLPEPPPLNKFIAAQADADSLADELAALAEREGVAAENSLENFFIRRVAGCDLKLWPAVEALLPVEYDLGTLLDFIKALQRGELTAQLFDLQERGAANRLALENWRKARTKRRLKPSRGGIERECIAARLDMLLEQRKLALDDPVSKYLPGFDNLQVLAKFNEADGTYATRPAKRPMTLRHGFQQLRVHVPSDQFGQGGGVGNRVVQ